MNTSKEITIHDIKLIARGWYLYLRSKWYFFLIAGLFFGISGIIYAWYNKPIYTAELTFASENETGGNLSAYAGIAAQFGLDLGGGSGSAFAGENLMYLMRSRRLITKALLSSININKEDVLLINYYINSNSTKSGGTRPFKNENYFFAAEEKNYNREQDSVLQVVYKKITKSLDVQKVDKKSDIISVKYKDSDELFAKLFVEKLVSNVTEYYSDYKIKKIRQNVLILQKQTDSVRNLISGNIVDIAVSGDLNINPTRQIVRTGIQRKQVDAQVNGALYTELVKNLELSKLTLRKETPLVQIIDSPMLPLEKNKIGRFKSAVFFAFVGVFLTAIFLIAKKLFSA